MMPITITQPTEVPLDKPVCLSSCGSRYRGCAPQCPKRWYEHGQAELEWLRERMWDRLLYYEEERDSANYRSHALPSAQMASFLRKLLSKEDY